MDQEVIPINKKRPNKSVTLIVQPPDTKRLSFQIDSVKSFIESLRSGFIMTIPTDPKPGLPFLTFFASPPTIRITLSLKDKEETVVDMDIEAFFKLIDLAVQGSGIILL